MKKRLHFGVMFLAGTLLNAQQNPTNFKYLDINQVKAGISCKNQLHWDSLTGMPSYEVPKGSGKHSHSASALWMGGTDLGGQLRVSAQTYRQNGSDFWPGPLSTVGATITASVSAAYNKVWKVSYLDINNFINNHVATNDILTWPGNGDVSQNQDPVLAPYIDVNGDGYYNSNDGDYPDIKGDEAVYAIFNDNLAAHGATQGNSVEVEIHLMAYAYGCPQSLTGHNELAYTTFYNYKVINRGAFTLQNFYIGLWSDAALGYPDDDYIGCDIQRDLAYTYNGSNFDSSSPGSNGYGNYPPAQGIALLKGPLADTSDNVDNNHNSIIDEPGERFGMSIFDYYMDPLPGTPQQFGAPSSANQYYGYITSHWRDGSPFTCGNYAYNGSTVTNYVFPDSSYPNIPTIPPNPCAAGWTEISASLNPTHLHHMMNCGPFTLRPAAIEELEYAYVTSFDSTANSPQATVQKLKADVDKVKAFYSMVYKPNCYQSAAMGVKELGNTFAVSIYPNPAKDLLTINTPGEIKGHMLYEITDVIGQTLITGEPQHAGQLSVPVAGLANGVYLIRLSINGRSTVKKFVKE